MAVQKQVGVRFMSADAPRMDLSNEDVQASILLNLRRGNRALENLRHALERDESEQVVMSVS